MEKQDQEPPHPQVSHHCLPGPVYFIWVCRDLPLSLVSIGNHPWVKKSKWKCQDILFGLSVAGRLRLRVLSLAQPWLQSVYGIKGSAWNCTRYGRLMSFPATSSAWWYKNFTYLGMKSHCRPPPPLELCSGILLNCRQKPGLSLISLKVVDFTWLFTFHTIWQEIHFGNEKLGTLLLAVYNLITRPRVRD